MLDLDRIVFKKKEGPPINVGLQGLELFGLQYLEVRTPDILLERVFLIKQDAK